MKARHSLTIAVAAIALSVTTVPLRASETDNHIESSFKKSFLYQTYLKDGHIKISSKDGAVTLTGVVFDETHKPMAQDTAEALPGVASVDNRIEIIGDRPAENSDKWVSMKVKTVLVFHRNMTIRKTEVYFQDGFVTLRGEAGSQAQKDLTTEDVKDVAGVKDVKNEMTVAATATKADDATGERIDDASITAQVKASLLSHRSTSALKTKVTTNDGVVTVSGDASSSAERELVTRLVKKINGVRHVINIMTSEAIVSFSI